MKLKRQLETAYDFDNIVSLENGIKDKQKQLEKLTDQNEQLKKVS